MKIAILTQPLRTNYGGILQNHALQQCLREMGHEPYTLDAVRSVRFPFWKWPGRLVKVALGKAPAYRLLYERRYEQDYRAFTQHTRDFVSRHIRLYPYGRLSRELTPDSFDAYVVGSDQVWRPDYNNIEDMFLGFTHGWPVKRVAYAASFGTDTWEFTPVQTQACARLAAAFDAVSVREDSGIHLCKNHLGVSAVRVLDPALLLPAEQYAALAGGERTDGGLFTHILDPTAQKQEIIRDLAARCRLAPYTCNQEAPEDALDVPIEKRIQPPVEQWLRSIRDAACVVTDSFHATVFAILFQKRFLVLANPERGLTRLQSLLAPLGLQDCLFTGKGTPNFPEIDYIAVWDALEQQRKASKAFLADALGKA
ncbi:MAG: polysaccharide pyruvyl transferase family protein [Bacteroidales bacterium]|nr:polysaccharide pyruvyl transferase family protein [Bacteroidales bacterium]